MMLFRRWAAGPLVVLLALIGFSSAAHAGEPIMPLNQVTAGMNCTAKTVFSGETTTEFPVTIEGIYTYQNNSFLMVRVGGAAASTGIAEGMSGSPVYCPGPNGPAIAGALSYGIGWENDQVGLATPIEVMLGETPTGTTSAQQLPGGQLSRTKPIGAAMTVSGLSAPVMKALQKRLGSKVDLRAAAGKKSILRPAATAELNPGDSVGVGYAVGDWSFGGIGTVSYRDNSRIWAFGHPLDDVGNSSLFLTRAPIATIVDAGPSSPYASYKLGSLGESVGLLDNDSANSISGQLGQLPPSTEQVAHIQGPKTAHVSAQLADESLYGFPHYGPIPFLAAGVSAAQASYEALRKNNVPQFTGRFCWTISVKQLQEPLRFCRSIVSAIPSQPGMFGGAEPIWPVLISAAESTAMGMIYLAEFDDLSITKVQVDGKVFPNLQLADLVSIKQTSKIKKGIVGLRLRYRNRVTGQTNDFRFHMPASRRDRGRSVTFSAPWRNFKVYSITDNSPFVFESQYDPTSPTAMEPAQNKAALYDNFEAINGTSRLLVGGLRGGEILKRVDLQRLLPVGELTLRLR